MTRRGAFMSCAWSPTSTRCRTSARRLAQHGGRGRLLSIVGPWRIAALAIALFAESTLARQQPTFRSTVDLIAVDVQVVDGNGRPIPRLGADRFAVEINGQKRRVVSVDFVEHADPDAPARLPRSVIDSGHPATAPPRVYVLGVDVSSFSVAESRAVIEGARDFIKHLQ